MEVMKRLEEIKKALLANGASNYVAKCNDMDKLFKYIKDNFIYLSIHNILTAEIIDNNVEFAENQIFANCNKNIGYILVTGDITVEVSGDAKVCAINNAKVIASGNAAIHAFNDAIVDASDNAQVHAKDCSNVKAYGYANVFAYGQSEVEAHNYVRVFGYNEAVIYADDYTHVEAQIGNSVHGVGNAFIHSLTGVKNCVLRHNAIHFIQLEHKILQNI